MKQYNFSRIPEKSIEKRALKQNQDFIQIAKKLGITQKDVDEKGLPDIRNNYAGSNIVPPPPGWSSWDAALHVVNSDSGNTFYEDIIRDWFDKPLEKEVIPEPPKPQPKKLKTPKKRGKFSASVEPKGKIVSEEVSSLFKAVSGLPTPEPEIELEPEPQPIVETPAPIPTEVSKIVEEIKPEKKISYPKLPKDLSGGSPKYKAGFDAESLPIFFSNDIDRAAYIISSKKGNKKSKRHDDYLKWCQTVTGWTLAQINILGLEIKSHMKDFYQTALDNDEFFITVPDFYSKMKSEIEGMVSDDEIEEEVIPPELSALLDEIVPSKPEFDFPGYSYSQFLEEYPGGTSKKPEKKKREKRKSGQLTKRQEQILQNILEDLIKIKSRLIEIKTNQEEKIAYEKRRDRLQAERLAFLEKERLIEALPESKTGTGTGSDTGTPGEKGVDGKPEGKPEQSWGERLANQAKSIFTTALISGFGNLFLGGGPQSQSSPSASTPSTPPYTQPEEQKQNNNPLSFTNLSKTALKISPIPGLNMIPFAEGGTITPVGENNTSAAIQPLEGTAITSRPETGTTYSRQYNLDDLKSPLAEVMKLPLKVAGAALLSAISKISSQFDVSDQTLKSDLSKMSADISKAFGLNVPTFSTSASSASRQTDSTDKEEQQLIATINEASNILAGPAPVGAENPPGTENPAPAAQPAPAGTPAGAPPSSQTPSNNPTGTTPARTTQTPPGSTQTPPRTQNTPAPAPTRSSNVNVPSSQSSSTPSTSSTIASSQIEPSKSNPFTIGLIAGSSYPGSSPLFSNELDNIERKSMTRMNASSAIQTSSMNMTMNMSASSAKADKIQEQYPQDDIKDTKISTPSSQVIASAKENSALAITPTKDNKSNEIIQPPAEETYQKPSSIFSPVTNNLLASSKMMMGDYNASNYNYNTSSDFRFSPVSRQTNIANMSVDKQVDSLKAEPSSKPIPSNFIATGLIPNEIRKQISPTPSNPKFITLPPQYLQQPNLNTIAGSEITANKLGKEPYGLAGISGSLRSSVLTYNA